MKLITKTKVLLKISLFAWNLDLKKLTLAVVFLMFSDKKKSRSEMKLVQIRRSFSFVCRSSLQLFSNHNGLSVKKNLVNRALEKDNLPKNEKQILNPSFFSLVSNKKKKKKKDYIESRTKASKPNKSAIINHRLINLIACRYKLIRYSSNAKR